MKKKKAKSYANTKSRLDKIFSIWTRLRFADRFLNVSCVSCGITKSVEQIQAGHFVSRSYLATRWHPENVAPQCMQCNVFKSGNLAAYAAWGVNRYGMDWPARMVSLSKQTVKFTRAELEEQIQLYAAKVKALS